jgi:predicted DsbA family dithiol-disulfide isomerase
VEIHPDTPPGGRPLTDLFRAGDIERMMKNVRISGAPFGITFADRAFLSNSRLALQAAEFAGDQGKFPKFHAGVFSAYFSLGLDIGSLDVLKQIAEDAGLDCVAMANSIRSGIYLPKLENARQEAGQFGVTAVPAFFIGENRALVGAQPLDAFRKVLSSL